jgi:hypothetical protein
LEAKLGLGAIPERDLQLQVRCFALSIYFLSNWREENQLPSQLKPILKSLTSFSLVFDHKMSPQNLFSVDAPPTHMDVPAWQQVHVLTPAQYEPSIPSYSNVNDDGNGSSSDSGFSQNTSGNGLYQGHGEDRQMEDNKEDRDDTNDEERVEQDGYVSDTIQSVEEEEINPLHAAAPSNAFEYPDPEEVSLESDTLPPFFDTPSQTDTMQLDAFELNSDEEFPGPEDLMVERPQFSISFSSDTKSDDNDTDTEWTAADEAFNPHHPLMGDVLYIKFEVSSKRFALQDSVSLLKNGRKQCKTCDHKPSPLRQSRTMIRQFDKEDFGVSHHSVDFGGQTYRSVTRCS